MNGDKLCKGFDFVDIWYIRERKKLAHSSMHVKGNEHLFYFWSPGVPGIGLRGNTFITPVFSPNIP